MLISEYTISSSSLLSANEGLITFILDEETIGKMKNDYKFQINYGRKHYIVYVHSVEGNKITLRRW